MAGSAMTLERENSDRSLGSSGKRLALEMATESPEVEGGVQEVLGGNYSGAGPWV